MNHKNTIPRRKATLIRFNDWIENKRASAKMQETDVIIENLLEKLDLYRIKLSETHTSIHDIQPLIHSMKMEKERLSDCFFSNDKELNDIITKVVQITDTELDTIEKGYYYS